MVLHTRSRPALLRQGTSKATRSHSRQPRRCSGARRPRLLSVRTGRAPTPTKLTAGTPAGSSHARATMAQSITSGAVGTSTATVTGTMEAGVTTMTTGERATGTASGAPPATNKYSEWILNNISWGKIRWFILFYVIFSRELVGSNFTGFLKKNLLLYKSPAVCIFREVALPVVLTFSSGFRREKKKKRVPQF